MALGRGAAERELRMWCTGERRAVVLEPSARGCRAGSGPARSRASRTGRWAGRAPGKRQGHSLEAKGPKLSSSYSGPGPRAGCAVWLSPPGSMPGVSARRVRRGAEDAEGAERARSVQRVRRVWRGRRGCREDAESAEGAKGPEGAERVRRVRRVPRVLTREVAVVDVACVWGHVSASAPARRSARGRVACRSSAWS